MLLQWQCNLPPRLAVRHCFCMIAAAFVKNDCAALCFSLQRYVFILKLLFCVHSSLKLVRVSSGIPSYFRGSGTSYPGRTTSVYQYEQQSKGTPISWQQYLQLAEIFCNNC